MVGGMSHFPKTVAESILHLKERGLLVKPIVLHVQRALRSLRRG